MSNPKSLRRLMGHRFNRAENGDLDSEDDELTPLDPLPEFRQTPPSPDRLTPPPNTLPIKPAVPPLSVRRGMSVKRISSPVPAPNKPNTTVSHERPSIIRRLSPSNRVSTPVSAKETSPKAPSPAHGSPPRRPERPAHGLYSFHGRKSQKSPPPKAESPSQYEDSKAQDSVPQQLSLRKQPNQDENSNIRARPAARITSRPLTQRGLEDLNRLIEETDNAFKGIDDVRLSTGKFDLPDLPIGEALGHSKSVMTQPRQDATGVSVKRAASNAETAARRTSSGVRAVRPRSVHKGTRPRSQTNPAAARREVSIAQQSGRKASVKKTNRRKNHQAGWAARSEAMAAKWNLPDNVTDFLSRQRFRGVEVDEVLTPAKLAQLKKRREEEQRAAEEAKKQMAAEKSVKSDTSEESAQDSGDSARSHSPTSAGRTSEEWLSSDYSRTSDEEMGDEPCRKSTDDASGTEVELPPKLPPRRKHLQEQDEELDRSSGAFLPIQTNHKLSTPSSPDQPMIPPKSSLRGASKPPQVALPPIPQKSPRSRMMAKLHAHEDEKFYYLRSTPYSMTQPLFAHGPIPFSKAETGRNNRMLDETQDWTAFQMAMLWGAEEPVVEDDGDDLRLADEVAAWLDMLGLDSAIGLQPDEPPSPGSSSVVSLSSTSSSYSDSEHMAFSGPSSLEASAPTYAPPMSVFNTSSIGSLSASHNAGQNRPQMPPRKPSVADSQATSPMPLVVGGDGEDSITEEDADRVQMSSTLTNDLGDFLQWEAQQCPFFIEA